MNPANRDISKQINFHHMAVEVGRGRSDEQAWQYIHLPFACHSTDETICLTFCSGPLMFYNIFVQLKELADCNFRIKNENSFKRTMSYVRLSYNLVRKFGKWYGTCTGEVDLP